jgi:hypothetical protein
MYELRYWRNRDVKLAHLESPAFQEVRIRDRLYEAPKPGFVHGKAEEVKVESFRVFLRVWLGFLCPS